MASYASRSCDGNEFCNSRWKLDITRRYKPRFAKKKTDREKKSIPVMISKKLIRYSQLVDDYNLISLNKTRSLMTLSGNCRPNKLVTRPF